MGVSELSSDSRDLVKAAEEGNEKAHLVQEMFYYGVKKYIGAYAAAMGGLDMIVFTGGIGENDYLTRREVCKGLEFLGIEFDEAVNHGLRGQDTILSKPTSRVKVALVTTNEELVIARETMHLVK